MEISKQSLAPADHGSTSLSFACWPGSKNITQDITRFLAKESRSFVVSSSIFLNKSDLPKPIPHYDFIYDSSPDVLADGGSCIANPDGTWSIEPVTDKSEIIVQELDQKIVAEERQNFDPSGHYSRPDVTKLIINSERQQILDNKS
jgi:nitrilase